MVLDTSLLNTHHYKVHMNGKVEQSRVNGSALPLHLSVVAVEKGAFGLPSTMVANFTLLLLTINWLYPLPKRSTPTTSKREF